MSAPLNAEWLAWTVRHLKSLPSWSRNGKGESDGTNISTNLVKRGTTGKEGGGV